MRGRKEFLLGNVANRVTHLARCTVTVVNTGAAGGPDDDPASAPDRLDGRAREIARVLGPTVVRGLAGRALRRPPDAQAPQQLREAFEELGPTFGKLGQMLSTRPDLVAPEYIEELRSLQSSVPPMTEAEVVAVMEQELGVPWEDVFGSIDPAHLAAGTIGQVHRATLADGRRVVVKVQRPGAAAVIDQDLTLLGRVTSPLAHADRIRRVIDLPTVVDQLGSSLRSELDFRMEAENLDRMAASLERYDRLAVPRCHHELSSSRLLVMDEIPGVPLAEAPAGPERSAAARQLLQAFYQQVLEEGFFHADPHPGNLMWADDRIWLLDLGMVGTLDDEIRQQLMLLLLAFAQGDGTMLAELALDLAGGGPPDLDRRRVRGGAHRAGERAPGSGARRDPLRGAAEPAHRPVAALRRAAPREPGDGRQGGRPGAAHRRRDRARDRPARGGGPVLQPELPAPARQPARPAGAALPGGEAALPRRVASPRTSPAVGTRRRRRSRSSGPSRTRAGSSRSASPSGLAWIAVASSENAPHTSVVRRLARVVATASTAALAVEVTGRGNVGWLRRHRH